VFAVGASGGYGAGGEHSFAGAPARGLAFVDQYPVQPGDTLLITVGGRGYDGYSLRACDMASGSGGGGGAASDVWLTAGRARWANCERGSAAFGRLPVARL
jgi:hypothetical protein